MKAFFCIALALLLPALASACPPPPAGAFVTDSGGGVQFVQHSVTTSFAADPGVYAAPAFGVGAYVPRSVGFAPAGVYAPRALGFAPRAFGIADPFFNPGVIGGRFGARAFSPFGVRGVVGPRFHRGVIGGIHGRPRLRF